MQIFESVRKRVKSSHWRPEQASQDIPIKWSELWLVRKQIRRILTSLK